MAFPDGWGRKCKLTIQASKVPGNLTDFPVLLTEATLPSEMFDADGSYPALNGGGDIRFSTDQDGVTQLPCDVVNFITDNNPANGKAEIHVKVPSVSSSTDTDIYVWYNKAGESQPPVTDTYGRNAVWADFDSVHHLQEAYDQTFVDSTGNGFDGTGNNLESNDSIDAKIGKGIDFEYDTADEWIENEEAPTPSGKLMTIELWANIDSSPSPQWTGLINKFKSAGSKFDYSINYGVISDQGFRGFIYYGNTQILCPFGSESSYTQWHYVVLVSDGSYLTIYVDNVQGSSIDISSYGNIRDSGGGLTIGRYPHASNLTFPGALDEIRVSLTNISSDWRTACFNNQGDPGTFVIEGTPEDASPPYTAPSSPLVTTYNSDLAGTDGESNPDNLVTHKCKFSAVAEFTGVAKYQIQVGTTPGGSEHWDSGVVSFGIPPSQGQRCTKIQIATKAQCGAWLQVGVQYYWRIRFFDSSEKPSEWTSDQTFKGVTPIIWDDGAPDLSGFNKRAIILPGTDHSELPAGMVLNFEKETGYAKRVADDGRWNEALQHSNNPIAYYDGFLYVAYLAQTDLSSFLKVKILKYKYSNGSLSDYVVYTTSTQYDTHDAPALLIGDDLKIHLIISGHDTQSIYLRSNNAHVAGSGIDITSWTSPASPTALSNSTYPRMHKDSHGNIFVFFRHYESNSRGHWCYAKSDDNGSSWGSRKYIAYFSDYVEEDPPSIYCGGSNIDKHDRCHLALNFWESYGLLNEGRAVTYVYSDLDESEEFTDWYEMNNGTSVGSSTTSRGSSNIQLGDLTMGKGIVKLWDDDSPPYDGPYYHSNGDGLAVDDQTQFPVFVFATYTEGNHLQVETPLYVVYWNDGTNSWDIRNLETDTGKKLWTHRQGGQIVRDGNGINIYGLIKPSSGEYFGGELYVFRGSLQNQAFTGEFLSSNSGKGCGMITTLPDSNSITRRCFVLNRGNDLILYKDIPHPDFRSDGNDVVIVKAIVVATGSCIIAEWDRLADTWNLENTKIKFAIGGIIPANQNYQTDVLYLMYWQDKDTSHISLKDPDNIFGFHENFENYADSSNLAGQGGWTLQSGSSTVCKVYSSDNIDHGHTMKLWSGNNIARWGGASVLRQDLGSVITDREIRIAIYNDNYAYSGHTWINFVDGSGNGFAFGISGNGIGGGYCAYKHHDGSWTDTATEINAVTWYQLTLRINSSGVSCYINMGDDPANRIQVISNDNHITDFRYLEIGTDTADSYVDHIMIEPAVSNDPETEIYDYPDVQGLSLVVDLASQPMSAIFKSVNPNVLYNIDVQVAPVIMNLNVPQISVSKGSISVSVAPAIINLNVPEISVAKGAISPAIAPAAMSLNVPAIDVSFEQNISVAATGLSLTVNDVGADKGPIYPDLIPAILNLNIPELTATKGPITSSINPAILNLNIPDIQIISGLFVDVDSTVLSLAIPGVSVQKGGLTPAISPAIIQLSVPEVGVTTGPVTISISPAIISLNVPEISVDISIQVAVAPAVLNLVGPAIAVNLGAINPQISVSIISLSIPAISVTPGGISVAIAPVILTLNVPDISVDMTSQIAIAPVTLNIILPNIQITEGAISVNISPTVLTLDVPDVGITLGPNFLNIEPTIINLNIPDVSVSKSLVVEIAPAIINLNIPQILVARGAINRQASPTVLDLAVPQISLLREGQSINISPMQLSLVVSDVAASLGVKAVSVDPAGVQLQVPPVNIIIGLYIGIAPSILDINVPGIHAAVDVIVDVAPTVMNLIVPPISGGFKLEITKIEIAPGMDFRNITVLPGLIAKNVRIENPMTFSDVEVE